MGAVVCIATYSRASLPLNRAIHRNGTGLGTVQPDLLPRERAAARRDGMVLDAMSGARVLQLLHDLCHFIGLLMRPRSVVVAENLFLRKQWATYRNGV